MGYDIEFIQLTVPAGTRFPVEPESAARLLKKAVAFTDLEAVRASLLKLDGCRPGPKNAVDYLGRGLSYARVFPRQAAIHIENNCSAGDLLKILAHLQKDFPALLIFDMQNKQLHTAESYKAWWARPL
ncbi:MAG: hypothetical protein QUV05_22745 [Phycisphaerae bacterium]|jgi:hypothetical protein|nr:hypothetical protein [Phycisphaerae bacterium]